MGTSVKVFVLFLQLLSQRWHFYQQNSVASASLWDKRREFYWVGFGLRQTSCFELHLHFSNLSLAEERSVHLPRELFVCPIGLLPAWGSDGTPLWPKRERQETWFPWNLTLRSHECKQSALGSGEGMLLSRVTWE